MKKEVCKKKPYSGKAFQCETPAGLIHSHGIKTI